jgi:hypothetical protein
MTVPGVGRLRFTNQTTVDSLDPLSPIHREQLRLSGLAYDGQDLPAAARLPGATGGEKRILSFCTHWDVLAGDTPAFDAWFFMADSGAFFRAGSTERVALVIQCGLECEDPELELPLGMAMVEADLLPEVDDGYERFAAALDDARRADT